LKLQFLAPHLSLVGLVVVSQKVQDTVNNQDAEFPLKVMLSCHRLAVGPLDGDDHIAQIAVLKG